MSENAHHQDTNNKYMLSLASIALLVVFLGVVFFLYMKSSKKSEVVFPAGLNYTGTETTPMPTTPPKKEYNWGQLSSAGDWGTFVSLRKQYTFNHPKELYPLIFPGDVNDSMTFDIADVPVQLNLMVLVENISNYDPKLAGQQEKFAKDYWKFFGGLKQMNTFEPYKTEKGLNGFKVNYVTRSGAITNDSYFLMIPGDKNRVIHFVNIFPKEAEILFTRILNSLDFKIPTPEPTK